MPASLDYVLLDVFTDRPFGGNPLAVFPHAEGLSSVVMQAIARELNLSETSFVGLPPQGQGGHAVRIFTPLCELPFAGHPTIGTALTLHGLFGGTDLVLHEKIGPVPVRICGAGDSATAVLSSPKIPEIVSAAPEAALLARLLGLDEPDVRVGAVAPACCSAGVPFTIIPVRDRAALARIRLDGALWQAEMAATMAPHIYVLTMEDWMADGALDARMFAPAMGIAEDPATGVAAVALGAFLHSVRSLPDGPNAFLIRQGTDMGRPSRVELTLHVAGGHLTGVDVGGGAVTVGHGAIAPGAVAAFEAA